MKKLLVIILTLALCVAVVGCAGGGSGNSSETESGFKAPAGYASIVQIEINPTVKLYLDHEGVVLAVEYVNTDAETAYKAFESELVGKDVKVCVETIVDITADIGYFAGTERDITVNVVASLDTVDKQELLLEISDHVGEVITEKNINAEIKLEIGGEDQTEQLGGIASDDTTSLGDIGFTNSSDQNEEVKSEPSDTTEKVSRPSNTTSDPLAPAVDSGATYWIIREIDAEMIERLAIKLYPDEGYCSYTQKPYSLEDFGVGTPITYSGTTWYESGGSGGGCDLTIRGQLGILSDGTDELTFTVLADGNLRVESINSMFTDFGIKVGDTVTKE